MWYPGKFNEGKTDQQKLHTAHIQSQGRLVLTHLGRDFVLRYERVLQSGRFTLPGESPWYDRWPWKQWWLPTAAAVLTFLTLEMVKWLIRQT